jgi:hypothetical protein
VEVLAKTIREDDPASLRYKAGLRNDIGQDGRSITVTGFTSSILAGSQGKSNRSLRSFVVA